MNKVSGLALIAALGLAMPALAQTPSDVRNHRFPWRQAEEVKIDRKAEPIMQTEKKSKKSKKSKTKSDKAKSAVKAAPAKKDAKSSHSKH